MLSERGEKHWLCEELLVMGLVSFPVVTAEDYTKQSTSF